MARERVRSLPSLRHRRREGEGGTSGSRGVAGCGAASDNLHEKYPLCLVFSFLFFRVPLPNSTPYAVLLLLALRSPAISHRLHTNPSPVAHTEERKTGPVFFFFSWERKESEKGRKLYYSYCSTVQPGSHGHQGRSRSRSRRSEKRRARRGEERCCIALGRTDRLACVGVSDLGPGVRGAELPQLLAS